MRERIEDYVGSRFANGLEWSFHSPYQNLHGEVVEAHCRAWRMETWTLGGRWEKAFPLASYGESTHPLPTLQTGCEPMRAKQGLQQWLPRPPQLFQCGDFDGVLMWCGA